MPRRSARTCTQAAQGIWWRLVDFLVATQDLHSCCFIDTPAPVLEQGQARLAIEIDGQAHAMGDRPVRDELREVYLARAGIQVMRYPASEVMRDPNGVADAIFDAARAR